ncbi:zinc ribbon domain-containing protein [Microbacterium gorillae]|uniref:zinc ribbon domain-containing protein n=1 Tax=Microbacterium gorillae TaxID=1231063 RepID=UPI003D9789FC
MIIYDFTCDAGHDFEKAVASMMSDNPPCPTCDAGTRRRPSRVQIGGRASTGVSRENMPRSWNTVGQGDRETVRHWHEIARQREKLEERNPELAGDRRPILAHEGIFAPKPLRAGDDIPSAVAAATAASAGQSHSHTFSSGSAS